jgi:hypothetical protein
MVLAVSVADVNATVTVLLCHGGSREGHDSTAIPDPVVS